MEYEWLHKHLILHSLSRQLMNRILISSYSFTNSTNSSTAPTVESIIISKSNIILVIFITSLEIDLSLYYSLSNNSTKKVFLFITPLVFVALYKAVF